MKILFVGPQSRDTAVGRIGVYCTRALKNLGYDFDIFDFRESRFLRIPGGSFFRKGIKKLLPFEPRKVTVIAGMESERMNKALLEKVSEYRPDILFVLTGETIFPSTLEEIKKNRVIIANWFHDTVLAATRKDFIQQVSRYYDYFFIVDSENVLDYIKIEAPFIKTIPLACNPEVHKTVNLSGAEKKKYASETCFLGSVYAGCRRKNILAGVTDFDLAIWGYWTEKIPELERCYREQHVYGEEAARIYNASKIILDMPSCYPTSAPEGESFHITPRVFEVPACGAFLLAVENPQLAKLYKIGEEMVCYSGEADLREKIRYYLDHSDERKRISKNGQERAHRDHTYEIRLKEIFSIIEKNG